MTVAVVDTLSGVPAAEWNRLAGDDPFLRHEFLTALHDTGCADAASGWTPQYLLLHEGGALAGAMPLYLKSHSYGEYVFDWAWADAYYRHSLDYYPKLLSAIPFTPVSGRRLLADNDRQCDLLITAALQLARELRVSSLHCLFPPSQQAARMHALGMMRRHGVQFHWTNRGYGSFEDFLSGMNHVKRKKIRQERRKVREAGIDFEWLEGAAIDDRHWAFFARCYRQTYREHRSTPYLNVDFFRRIGATMPDHTLLIIARRQGTPVAATFNIRSRHSLFGRHWGALEYHPALHFEACYYQSIEYCIARGLQSFEGGAQGEHKIARGLLPVETCSTHWLAHPEFASAVEEFLAREARGMANYVDELNDRSPFKIAEGGA